jgi:GNAT superfamily N-acetyltransferase
MKIGRLAVDDRHAKKGIGTQMVYFSMFLVKEIYSKYCGCRFITLDAKRDPRPERDSLHFYKKLGFQTLKEREKGAIPMYLDIWLRGKSS